MQKKLKKSTQFKKDLKKYIHKLGSSTYPMTHNKLFYRGKSKSGRIVWRFARFFVPLHENS